jgi:hypothetical protein
MNAAEILNAAAGHMQDRAATYDKPEGERSMAGTVEAFKAITGHDLTEEQGWLFMALLKAVRSQQGAFRADSYEDGAAYFALAGEAAHKGRHKLTTAFMRPTAGEVRPFDPSIAPKAEQFMGEWPGDDRIEIIGQNGNDGAAYASKGPCLGCGGAHALHACGRRKVEA